MPPAESIEAPGVEGTERRDVTVQTADAGPVRLSVLEGGEGAPTLLLHGWPEHAWSWRHVIPLLSDDLHVIAPDNRGFGWSDTPGRGYDHQTFASDAIALLDELGIERAHVIGHDWGGAAAFEIGLDHPERVDRMLILNTLAPWVQPSFGALKHFASALYVPGLALFGEWVARNRPAQLAHGFRRDVKHSDLFTAADARAYAEVLTQPERARATRDLYRHYLRTALSVAGKGPRSGDRLAVPTHFLFATGDKAIAAAMLRGIEDHCDDLTLEFTPAAGHFIAEELPELVARRAREHFGLV